MTRGYDLNLLHAMNVLIEESSVTGAAQRLQVSAATISRTLSKIRATFDDPILVQMGRNMVPTPRALQMQPRISRILAGMHDLMRRDEELDLTGIKPIFTIRAADVVVGPFATKLLQTLRGDCPDAAVVFASETDGDDSDALRRGAIDLYIGATENLRPEIMRQTLFESRFHAVVRAGHPILLGEITPQSLVQYDHISVSRRSRRHGPIDDALQEEFGLSRNVALLVPSYYTAMQGLHRTDLILPVPDVAIERDTLDRLGLYAFPLPLKLTPVNVFQAWHPRHDSDVVHRWLRRTVLTVTSGWRNRSHETVPEGDVFVH
ncbi:LysR family transcriptional regulator [Acetobacter malorum DSM 14337]|uniref:LysR family transcriptional regulator n=1 Tax=Acetobacter malorum DSM 14337 TaxID=1307910 RepID=A0ABQ0PSK4_9PROT|nr:LysR family transcriptional regulator [Acetobacter malorum]KXV09441.1 LysR family transcriptional regulator [Acetobacter malorum]GBQ79758.1 LysR family transcriptional regulator [Acetobacter malorum DSM 14337]